MPMGASRRPPTTSGRRRPPRTSATASARAASTPRSPASTSRCRTPDHRRHARPGARAGTRRRRPHRRRQRPQLRRPGPDRRRLAPRSKGDLSRHPRPRRQLHDSATRTAPPAVTTKSLNEDGTYRTQTDVYDGAVAAPPDADVLPSRSADHQRDLLRRPRLDGQDHGNYCGPASARRRARRARAWRRRHRQPVPTQLRRDGPPHGRTSHYQGNEKWPTTTSYGGDRISVLHRPAAPPPRRCSTRAAARPSCARLTTFSVTGAFHPTAYGRDPLGRPRRRHRPRPEHISYRASTSGPAHRQGRSRRRHHHTAYDDADRLSPLPTPGATGFRRI